MESQSFENLEIIQETLLSIRKSIDLLLEWNKGVESTDEWSDDPTGMQKLAANCMIIEAIGEAVKRLDKRAGREFLDQRPELPWQEIMSMRNHIAHGYFDLDDAYVLSVIQNDLVPLSQAIDFLLDAVKSQIVELEVDAQIEQQLIKN